ncbi:MAG: hypothetical protein QM750_11895 [Rubrivivax sp.]
MQFIVHTPSGEQVPMEAFAGHVVHCIGQGQDGALAMLRHVRESRDAAAHPEVAQMADAMLATPERAAELINTMSDATCARFAAAVTLAYSERTPGASVSMVPESDEDRAFVASVQEPRPGVRQ